MIKWIGAGLILLGAGGFGVGKAAKFYRQMRQLHSFSNALEILKCELNYTLLPLPELCRVTAERSERVCAGVLRGYARLLEQGSPRKMAAAACLENNALCLPEEAQTALLEMLSSMGRYDLDGENRLLSRTQLRLEAAIRTGEAEKRPMVKGYAALALCTGAALAILLM